MNANLALIINDARNNDLGDLTDTEVLAYIANTIDPADLVGTTDPVGLAYLAFLTSLTAVREAHAAHLAQGWHSEWSRHTVITNLIDTMSDIRIADITDPTVTTILANPTLATDIASLTDLI